MILRLENSDMWKDSAVDVETRFTYAISNKVSEFRGSHAKLRGRTTECELWGPTRLQKNRSDEDFGDMLRRHSGCMSVAGRGVVTCHSSDQFCKAKGRKYALARAMQAAGFSKADRTKLWAAYFAVVKDGPKEKWGPYSVVNAGTDRALVVSKEHGPIVMAGDDEVCWFVEPEEIAAALNAYEGHPK